MIIDEVVGLLEQKIGINADSIGRMNLIQSIEGFKKSNNIKSDDQLLDKLLFENEFLELLIEDTIVPETWFFRDIEPFSLLKRIAGEFNQRKVKEDKFRILSAPCSTGEEPYSIAITLLEAGLKPDDFTIDAVDLSRKSLKIAREEIYSKNSFREKIVFSKEYFHISDDQRRINENVAKCVNITRANIIDSAFLAYEQPYDVIFCRNLFIYLTDKVKIAVLKNLSRLLKNGGILFVGHSELSSFLQNGYEYMDHKRAFACKKTNNEKNIHLNEKKSSQIDISFNGINNSMNYKGKSISLEPATSKRTKSRKIIAKSEIHELNTGQTSSSIESIEENDYNYIRTLADAGRLDEALKICLDACKKRICDPRMLLTIGLIYEAKNEHDEAEEFFNKTIYLDPGNKEAIIHLSLLYDSQGDTKRSQILKSRISRIES